MFRPLNSSSLAASFRQNNQVGDVRGVLVVRILVGQAVSVGG